MYLRRVPRPAQRPTRDARARLVADARAGGVTLVLGAGVSIPYGIPGWKRLVGSLWGSVFPRRPNVVTETDGKEAPLPQFLPFSLELVAEKVGPERFARALRRALYADVSPPTRARLAARPDDTLSVLARLLVAEHARGGARRVVRVVTFNVDDMLEQAVHEVAGAHSAKEPVLKVIARASQHPRQSGGRPIPVYHVHGYLPQRASAAWHEPAPDALVFTDAQYWASSSSPQSYANRVMAAALHDSHCVFVGTSMTDVNVLRWLAQRANEIRMDKAVQFDMRPDPSASGARQATLRALGRHYWIRTPGCDPTGFVSRCMALRGIRSVAIPGWGGAELRELMGACFG